MKCDKCGYDDKGTGDFAHVCGPIRMKKYHTLVLIGRFQPTTVAHAEIIRRATTMARQLIIVVGSAKQPRTYKNPWTSMDRQNMLVNLIEELPKNDCAIRIEHNIDTLYNDTAWATRVQAIVQKHTSPGDKIGLIGHKKDSSSFYLDIFPQWDFEEVELLQPLNATNIRELYFRSDANMNFLRGVIPTSTYRMLEGWKDTPEFNSVVEEREFVENYKKQYSSLPYPPVFVTTDCVVVCSGHVLLVERKASPGKGLMALPGGFLNQSERIEDGALRELKEETKIKVPVPVLRGSIAKRQVFDHPDRSARGRTITHAFLIQLPDGELPKVKGSDDAVSAQWVPISKIDSNKTFEDHAEIISYMLGLS